MLLIDQIAEQKIAEAINNGELDDLPGAGRPLNLDDDSQVPEELRVGYRLLKNAGFLPPEARLRKDISNLDTLLAQATSERDRSVLGRRMNYLLMQLDAYGSRSPLIVENYYMQKLTGK